MTEQLSTQKFCFYDLYINQKLIPKTHTFLPTKIDNPFTSKRNSAMATSLRSPEYPAPLCAGSVPLQILLDVKVHNIFPAKGETQVMQHGRL